MGWRVMDWRVMDCGLVTYPFALSTVNAARAEGLQCFCPLCPVLYAPYSYHSVYGSTTVNLRELGPCLLTEEQPHPRQPQQDAFNLRLFGSIHHHHPTQTQHRRATVHSPVSSTFSRDNQFRHSIWSEPSDSPPSWLVDPLGWPAPPR